MRGPIEVVGFTLSERWGAPVSVPAIQTAMDPTGAGSVLDTPWARECMACTGPREPVVMVTMEVAT